MSMTTQSDERFWSAFAEPSRLRVLDLLVSNGEASAWSMASHLPFSRQAVAKHLVVLENAKLVNRRKQGREVLFRVDPARLHQATRTMSEIARQWEQRLDTIKQLAEKAHADAQRQVVTSEKSRRQT
jgi:DNA-binding transcriptional ArsR family regulator